MKKPVWRGTMGDGRFEIVPAKAHGEKMSTIGMGCMRTDGDKSNEGGCRPQDRSVTSYALKSFERVRPRHEITNIRLQKLCKLVGESRASLRSSSIATLTLF